MWHLFHFILKDIYVYMERQGLKFMKRYISIVDKFN